MKIAFRQNFESSTAFVFILGHSYTIILTDAILLLGDIFLDRSTLQKESRKYFKIFIVFLSFIVIYFGILIFAKSLPFPVLSRNFKKVFLKILKMRFSDGRPALKKWENRNYMSYLRQDRFRLIDFLRNTCLIKLEILCLKCN